MNNGTSKYSTNIIQNAQYLKYYEEFIKLKEKELEIKAKLPKLINKAQTETQPIEKKDINEKYQLGGLVHEKEDFNKNYSKNHDNYSRNNQARKERDYNGNYGRSNYSKDDWKRNKYDNHSKYRDHKY